MIVVDVETTGLDPKINSIVSIGAVNFFNPENSFYDECRMWDGAEVFMGNDDARGALEVNGFTIEQITDRKKKSIEELAQHFDLWVKNYKSNTLAAMNPFFDYSFISDAFRRANIRIPFQYRTVDLHSICYENYIKKSLITPNNREIILNSYKIFNYIGLDNEPIPHNALTGAKFEAEAFSRLIYGKTLLKDFRDYPVPDYLK